MNDVKRALLGDHEAAKRLTDAGVLVPCPMCGATIDRQAEKDTLSIHNAVVVSCKQRFTTLKKKPASPGTPARRF